MIIARLQTMFFECKCIICAISDSKKVLIRLNTNFKSFNLSNYDLI